MTIATSFSAQALRQARLYSFYPANAARYYSPLGASTLLTTSGAAATATDRGTIPAGDRRFDGFRHTDVTGDDQIVHVQMIEEQTDRGKAVRVLPTLARRLPSIGEPPGVRVQVAPPADSFLAYFLPWDSRGALVELTIPPGTGGPRFFFTAALSGCSIFFCGPATNPTIYHCGTAGATGGGRPTTGNPDDFFLDLIRRCRIHLGLGRQDGALATDARRVRRTDYMVLNGGGVAAGIEVDLPAMLNADQAAFTGRRLHLEQMHPWGCVFGIRTGTNWAFYLQVNATYVYRRRVTETGWGMWWINGSYFGIPWRQGYERDEDGQQLAASPLFIKKIFPLREADQPGDRGVHLA